jgi:ubiquinone/menaquinone biosynthesis C-methylase UbiE
MISLNKEKKSHYDKTKRFFKIDAEKKKDFYKNRSIEDIKYDVKKRKMWDIYVSVLKDIIESDSDISSAADVGCGMGNFILEILEYKNFKKIVGLDFLTEAFNIAKKENKLFSKCDFLQGDIRDIPFEPNSFDIVFCLNLLHHIHKDD